MKTKLLYFGFTIWNHKLRFNIPGLSSLELRRALKGQHFSFLPDSISSFSQTSENAETFCWEPVCKRFTFQDVEFFEDLQLCLLQ